MIQKNTDIHIRVSEKDKKALQRYAKRAGLSLSAYLLMSGLNQPIHTKPSEALHDCYSVVVDLQQTFRQSTARSVEQRLNYLHDKLLVVYHEQEVDSGGNDQNLGN